MKLFWGKGFDATSVDELANAMGIGRPSMYNAFGDKEAIFMRCLAHYDETTVSGPLRILAEAPTAAAAIEGYLQAIAVGGSGDPTHRGCLFVSTINDDPKIRDYLTARFNEAEQSIARRLTAAVAAGELPANFPVAQRARRTVNTMLAIAVRGRQGAAHAELLADARDGAAAVLA